MGNSNFGIAAFERKLNIANTAYDQFAEGWDDAMTAEQLRGMVVFFCQANCIICPAPPHFHDGVLSSIGTTTSADKNAPLDDDPGFAAVMRREEVVEFYNNGGRRGRGKEDFAQDAKVTKLDLSEQEKKDLVAF